MKRPEYWQDPDRLAELLSDQLAIGRLALLLGAGVSQPLGLPGWRKLVSDMSLASGNGALKKSDDPEARALSIKDKFGGNEKGFTDLVKSVLYRSYSMDFATLVKNPLLRAIGALVVASQRGSASKVVTLNYDDVLESYLEYFGYVVNSVSEEAHWESDADVTVYHPHGFLPYSKNRRDGSKIVLTKKDFLETISSEDANCWRSLLLTWMRTHTVLHLGLSGDDLNIHSLMKSVAPKHPAKSSQMAYAGVSFALKSQVQEDAINVAHSFGIATFLLESWDELPEFLLRVCQEASKKRSKVNGH